MDTNHDKLLLSQILATNRELVTVNQSIAESLARLERSYADQVQLNLDQHARFDSFHQQLHNQTHVPKNQIIALIAVLVIIFLSLAVYTFRQSPQEKQTHYQQQKHD